MGGEPEQTVHSVEDVGWFHHAWDEVGPQLVTGVCSIVGLVLVALIAMWGRKKYMKRGIDFGS